MFDNDIELARHCVDAQSVQGYTKRAILARSMTTGTQPATH